MGVLFFLLIFSSIKNSCLVGLSFFGFFNFAVPRKKTRTQQKPRPRLLLRGVKSRVFLLITRMKKLEKNDL